MEYKTMAELAEHFGVHYNTVRKWVKMGAPCYKVGYFTRFKLEEVEQWMKEQKGGLS